MKIFLLWKHIGDPRKELDPIRVASRLRELFLPLFEALPPARTVRMPNANLAYLELPVGHWTAAMETEDETSRCFAFEYPINARSALSANGPRCQADHVIPALCRKLQDNPLPLLRELAPPFSLVWADRQSGETYVQNDGLGHAPLFEFEENGLWALTNKVFALGALGVPLDPDQDQWAVRLAMGWFPLQMTGFRSVRFLAPGTQLRLDADRMQRSRFDLLSDWVNPGSLPAGDCLELARSSLLNLIDDASQLWNKPTAGLSGGWDSRAVVASLLAHGTRFSARVRGHPNRPDVIIASRLAELAGIKLKKRSSGGLPAEDARGCKRSIKRALLWQTGQLATHKHVSFLANRKHLTGGSVNIMGAAGEICRGFYANKLLTAGLADGRYKDRFIDFKMSLTPPFMRKSLLDLVRDTLRASYRQADDYAVEGLRRLDFFYLFERTRRWRSGALGAQPGQAIAPFLNPGLIRATYGFPAQKLLHHPFHRHVVETLAPRWIDVPYADAMEQEMMLSPPHPDRKRPDWRLPVANETYDRMLHWKVVGEPLVREALQQGGFWTGIFDPDLARKHWSAAPDALAIAHLLPLLIEEIELPG